MWYDTITFYESWRRWRLRSQESYVSEAWIRNHARLSRRDQVYRRQWRWPVVLGCVEADLPPKYR
jgi:hypothetical protein